MHYYTVHYRFSQRFPFPARKAYDWSTDYRGDDLPLLGQQGTREVERIDDATLILTDTRTDSGKPETKVRLVRLFPDILTWTNTRLSDVGKHSQFIYQIVPDGVTASRLEFTGAQVEGAGTKPSKPELAAATEKYAKADALIWVNLAAAMKKDLAPRRSPGTSRNRAR
ncbi:MAG: hypothetical protein OK449_06525 [Thaumarchaeota archaeon]|nr:hypothetical protein [Nitrososphaerota archaeon]